jgi:hypothetical protein
MNQHTHAATFPSKWSAKAFVSKSRFFDAVWLCPICRFWVAGKFEEAPVEETPKGIFTKEVQ